MSKTQYIREPLVCTKITGKIGENLACNYLENCGYEILARNWRTRFGEIDIICLDGEAIVFVEVKNLPHSTPEYVSIVLNKKKQQKIIDTSKHFLNSYREYNSKFVRYDVVVLCQPNFNVKQDFLGNQKSHWNQSFDGEISSNENLYLEHITAAFSESV